jgi:hypothetical protein
VPQQGSPIVFRSYGLRHWTMTLISGLGVKYWPAPLFVSSAFFLQDPFVDFSFCIHTHHDPDFFVDHVNDLVQHCRIADLVLGFEENLPEHPWFVFDQALPAVPCSEYQARLLAAVSVCPRYIPQGCRYFCCTVA